MLIIVIFLIISCCLFFDKPTGIRWVNCKKYRYRDYFIGEIFKFVNRYEKITIKWICTSHSHHKNYSPFDDAVWDYFGREMSFDVFEKMILSSPHTSEIWEHIGYKINGDTMEIIVIAKQKFRFKVTIIGK